jgi:hypothetical protein
VDSPVLIAIVGIAAIVAIGLWLWRVKGIALSSDIASAIADLLQSLFR